ncbi:hypothetical protein A2U01_0110858, partial [Trifolium medium]|nr:hypothetical protein [Trifolium medium]
ATEDVVENEVDQGVAPNELRRSM